MRPEFDIKLESGETVEVGRTAKNVLLECKDEYCDDTCISLTPREARLVASELLLFAEDL